MCWQCDNPHATVDDYLNLLRDLIRDNGWVAQFVEKERRPFGYTVGLHDWGLPELMITGLPQHRCQLLLNSVAHQMVDEAMQLKPGEYIDFQGELLLEVVEVDHPDVHLTFAVSIADAPIRAFQLVWTDDRQLWPWDTGWSRAGRIQPVFGKRTLR